MAPVYIAPNKISAEAGSMLNVIGTKTASAMVAVNPGMDPTIVPATTPNKANAMFSGVIADKKCPNSIVGPPPEVNLQFCLLDQTRGAGVGQVFF